MMDPLSALAEHVRAPGPLYIVVGGESLLRRAAVEQLRIAVASGPGAAFNDASFTAGNTGEGNALDFSDTARTAPMMATRRFVLLRQIEEANAALLDAVLEYVQKPVDTTTLVITGEKFPAATGGMDRGLRIQNAAKKTGVVLKLDIEPRDRAAYASATAKKMGATLDSGAASLLITLTGDDLSALVGDVEKCANFVGEGGRITEAVVEEVCVSTADADTWGLTNAIIARDQPKALESLHRLLEDGEPPHKLLGGVAWQLRQALALQDALKRGIPTAQAGLKMHPRAAAQIEAMVKKRPLSPSALLDGIAQVNRAMNSSRAGDRRVFETWVIGLLDSTR